MRTFKTMEFMIGFLETPSQIEEEQQEGKRD